jgi:ribosome-associated heat shock protein Hsp15
MNSEAGCRIDVWLWRARFFKTRTLAARGVESGSIRLIRGELRSALDKPGRSIKAGDVLALALGARRLVLKVEALGERRGPADEARELYRLLDVSAPD